jgi:hypothetical protein
MVQTIGLIAFLHFRADTHAALFASTEQALIVLAPLNGGSKETRANIFIFASFF